jgi:hypothetical protein
MTTSTLIWTHSPKTSEIDSHVTSSVLKKTSEIDSHVTSSVLKKTSEIDSHVTSSVEETVTGSCSATPSSCCNARSKRQGLVYDAAE